MDRLLQATAPGWRIQLRIIKSFPIHIIIMIKFSVHRDSTAPNNSTRDEKSK
ncbi:hypothetical protein [Burkholderia sp. Bp9143]|uniref:hypothetical protein n=1 Tax=Burkholderia sp. Bp9143 TaxID=2184574 RepID=UPI001627851E|nr:hypothetical protein [Burkholderia sp. Bp9143]